MHPGREAIDDSVRILKHGETFAVFDRHGDAAPSGRTSSGLYHDATRHLSVLVLEIAGERPLLLKSTITYDNLLFAIDLTNPDLVHGAELEADTVHFFRGKLLRDGVLHERLRVTNFGQRSVTFPVTWRFAADFADIFEIRGHGRARRGRRQTPTVRADGVVLAYRGLDGVLRRTTIVASPAPQYVTASELRFELTLAPHQETTIELQFFCDGEVPRVPRPRPSSFDDAYRTRCSERGERRARLPRITSDNPLFDRWLERSLADLAMMLTPTAWGPYPYAGIPWYSTVFGRDGILTARSMLWADPSVALGVLGYLGSTQAEERDDSRDAEPGKILHELRRGEMAALREHPFQRYYGTIDATPLYVALAGATWRRTGDLAALGPLRPHVDRALAWIDDSGDLDGDGFVEYGRRSPSGLVQQGWKDSQDSIFHADGALAQGPIALCEVQGYAFAARRAGADLARAFGDLAHADALDARAAQLRARFEDAFWSARLGTYAIALDGAKRPCEVRTSNPGHCLWTGIVGPDRAAKVAACLTSEAMFTGWGVRTVAAGEVRYNPMSYHNGSVWPHDTAICAAGLARYGEKAAALRIFTALHDAAGFIDLHRLPELVCGFARKPEQGPVLYPVACAPQAWASAAVLLLLEACLGLEIDAPAREVRLVAPRLPEWLGRLSIENLRVAGARVDLRLVRAGADGRAEVEHGDSSRDVVVRVIEP